MSTTPRPRRLIGVSTKMYFSFARTTGYIVKLQQLLSSLPGETLSRIGATTDVFVIPDHVSLVSVIQQVQLRTNQTQNKEEQTQTKEGEETQTKEGEESQREKEKIDILVGAQDAHHSDSGAFTGEVSPAVLSEVGCRLLEINHAERRKFFGETDASAALKVAAAVRNGLVPLICVGETSKPPSLSLPSSTTGKAEGKGGEGKEKEEEGELDIQPALQEISTQIQTALSSLSLPSPSSSSSSSSPINIILAYEPVWAIGAPEPASPSYVVAMAREIRKLDCLRGFFSTPTSTSNPTSDDSNGSIRILYGGSAGPGLFEHLKTEVDGLFLGRFAHDPEMFVRTIVEVATA